MHGMTPSARPHHFHFQSRYPCSVQSLYEYHRRPGALERLLPPWDNTRVLAKTGTIEVGDQVSVQMRLGPVPLRFVARHTRHEPGRMFVDEQLQGPFRLWRHSHRFSGDAQHAVLDDDVDLVLPGQSFLPRAVFNQIDRRLNRMFHHREQVLRHDLDLHQRCSRQPLRILISGAGGVLGRELMPLLTTGGHRIWRLVRRPPDTDNNEIFWDPESGILQTQDLPELDAVIHLAGEYIGLTRWTEEKKRRVLDSRVKGTSLLVKSMLAMARPPKTFLTASAVGYYGNSGEREVPEEQGPGTDFLSQVCSAWEEAARPAASGKIRTVMLRLGVGFTPRGGALERILAAAPLGFPARFSHGNQYISWISSDDMIGAMLHALTCVDLAGPVNIAAPEPVTNRELMRALAKLCRRPLLPPIPASFLRLMYGQMAPEILLSGCRVATTKLQRSGYRFRHPTLDSALRFLLGKSE
jgi:uncharacterized protein (TIGR01777 family)